VQLIPNPGHRESPPLHLALCPLNAKGVFLMRRRRLLSAAPMVVAALVVVGLALALGACSAGGSKEQAKARTLPPVETTLRPGEYRSEEFEPSVSFRVGEGWSNGVEELPDYIQLRQQGEIGSIQFANVKEVFKPGTTNVVEAPEDLVGWLQHHPYLKTSKPEPVTVGGVKGEQMEVLIDHLPKDPNGYCDAGPSGCLDIFNLSGGDEIGYFGKNFNARRLTVLEDVKGDTVVIWYAGPPDTFDKFAPKAQKVVDSVKWTGS
jgi:hypothetical protein